MIKAETVKAYRRGLGLTQGKFAERCGVSIPLVQLWESRGISEKDVKKSRVIVDMYFETKIGE